MCRPTIPAPSPFPVVPEGLPSVWDLAQLAKACADEAARIDAAPLEAWKGEHPAVARESKADALDYARAREAAIIDLADTVPAVTLRDALVLVLIIDRHIDAFDHDTLANEGGRALASRLRRLIDNAAPVIAAATGVCLEDLQGGHIQKRRASTIGPLTGATAPGGDT